ncbi:hypothetical protein PV327_005601 [Microctonus hyperodae]|uniref:Cap-specific mRNA (nucleoside-2'-O-)-methyltransferase 2 n=1 Tax=Microctonus hyperodae TaxID=165561 RepID=A0AA39KZW7_MICHY|nr:hypothetical protein PV327_005601 [Microctonus hyperodae]
MICCELVINLILKNLRIMDYDEETYSDNTQLLCSQYQLPVAFMSSQQVKKNQRIFTKNEKHKEMVSAAVQKMFNKYVEIDNKNCELPTIDTMFIDDPWIIADLKELKGNLNEIKSKLNDYNLKEWRSHTKRKYYAGEVIWRVRNEINAEFPTQAWCKFYENLSFFKLIPEKSMRENQLKSIHLCEAPGAFVTALNHWLKLNAPLINWDWTATTLNPYYEGNSPSFMLNDDRFISHTINNWYFGADNTGNLMNLKNLDLFVESERKNRDKIMLITADGSIDCLHRPDEQEKIVSHLHYCETITALHLLNKNGNFVIKLFTIFEYQTICLMYLLSCCFNKITIRKPATSKEGNSEIYVICLDFKGYDYISPYLNIFRKHYEKFTDKTMFRKNDIPNSFIEQLIKSSQLFKSHQCDAILNNIRTFNAETNKDVMNIKRIRKATADYFIKFCKLEKLPFENMKIVGTDILNQSCCQVLDNRHNYDSYNERQVKGSMKPEDLLLISFEDLQAINITIETGTIEYIQFIDDKPEVLKISTAISYENIQSSKFCLPKIMRIFNSAFEIKNQLISSWQYPDDKVIGNLIKSNTNDNNKYLVFHYTVKYDGFNVIEKIYSAITNLKLDQTLVLIGYSLLTQFNVGIIYFLAHTFKHVEMQFDNELGVVNCSIVRM